MDLSGYIGVLGWSCCLLLPILAWRSAKTDGTVRRKLIIYVAALVFTLILMFGTRLPGYGRIPFVYLNKGTYRLYPYLAILLGTGLAYVSQRLAGKRELFLCLIMVGIGEQLPFSTRPYF